MQNEKNISTTDNTLDQDSLYQKRLELLKAEINLQNPDLVNALGAEIKTLIFVNDEIGKDLDPSDLRMIGSIAVMCRLKDVPMIFCRAKSARTIVPKSYPQAEAHDA